jgi:hypothetical protein
MWWANVRLHRTKVYYSRQVDDFFIRKTPWLTTEYSNGSLMPSVVVFFFSRVVMRLVVLEKAKLDSIMVSLVGSILPTAVRGWSVKMENVSRTEVEARCPTALILDCVLWSVAGGKCQALHWIARVMNEAGDPVNEGGV